MAQELQEKITSFINSVAEAPAQKTKEWYVLKTKTIGGSEVATVLGINPFKSVKGLIAEKIGLDGSTFSGNIATRWGNMFESVTREWTQKVLLMDEKIEETGSIPGIINRQRYSPDGLGIVQLVNADDELDFYVVLFEFKSPYRSLPDGKIPKHYVPQLQTGMLTIPLAELSIFVNNSYRKCPIRDIGFDMKYDLVFHDGDSKKRKTKAQEFKSVLACGLICFYQTKENYELGLRLCGYGSESESESDSDTELNVNMGLNGESNIVTKHELHSSSTSFDINILMNSRESPIDFGVAKYNILNRLFELCEEKRIGVIYYPMILNQQAVNEIEFIQMHKKDKQFVKINPKKIISMQLQQFLSFCEEKEYFSIGYLPWKLLKSDIITEIPDEKWREKIEEPILDTLKKIDDILSSDDPHEKYYEYFPDINAIVEPEVDPADVDIMKNTKSKNGDNGDSGNNNDEDSDEEEIINI